MKSTSSTTTELRWGGDMGLMRRRGLLKESSDIDWDLEWDYTMGLLENNGWTKDVSGTASTSMQEQGEQLLSNYSAYVRLNPPSAYATMTSGVMEVEASCTYSTGGGTNPSSAQNLRLALSNGTNGNAICVNGSTAAGSTGQGLKLQTNSNPRLCEYLSAWVSGSTHTVRLVLNNGSGEVWLDGVLIKSNIASSTIVNTVATRIWCQNAGGGSYPTYIKSVKLKKYS